MYDLCLRQQVLRTVWVSLAAKLTLAWTLNVSLPEVLPDRSLETAGCFETCVLIADICAVGRSIFAYIWRSRYGGKVVNSLAQGRADSAQ